MTDPKTTVRLRHILESAREANSIIKDKSRKDLDKDRLLNLALVRLLEMIGEAANQISKEERIRYPDVPWSQIIGLRNRLIHGYNQVDFDILWQILNQDLPSLIKSLEKIIPDK